MKIAIVGAGNIGRTLGQKWELQGHSVVYGVRNPEGKREVSAVATIAEAVESAEIVLFAIPGHSMVTAVPQISTALDGKIIIDATNNMQTATMNQLALLKSHAPHAFIFRAFSNLGWENFAKPIIDGVQLDLLYCGNEANRPIIANLIREIGLNPIYIGDTSQADLIDATTKLWFALAFKQKMGRRIGFKLLIDA